MRRTTLLFVTATLGALALGATSAQAGLLGGGGGIGGGLGGGLGGVSGGLGGGFGGSLGGIGGSLDAAGRVQSDLPTPDVHKARAPSVRPPAVRAPRVQLPAASAASVPLVRGVTNVIAIPTQPVGVVRDVALGRRRQTEALVGGGVAVLSEPQSVVYMDRQADELRDELAGTGVEVERQGEAIVLQLPSDVTFAFDKSNIRPRFYSALDAVARTLNRYPATFVDVIGHTDAVGSDAYNQALSVRRAASVADYVEQREEIPARLFVEGRGKSEPIATNATVEGRAENRRVEILLHPYT